jgi:DNA-binding transcriptional ArsR family regulator
MMAMEEPPGVRTEPPGVRTELPGVRTELPGVRTELPGVRTEPPGVREIDSVEELRALADPVRLAILSALDTHGPDGELPVMSVKELAQHLGEPQTKLYRHVKQLEAAGLIEVAATRMVSGILEQRYRARHRDLRLSEGLYRRHADESQAAVRSAFDAFLTGLFDQARLPDWPSDDPDKPVLLVFTDRVSPAAAERIRARLAEVTTEIAEAEAGDIPVNVAIGFYRPPA